MTRNAKIKLMTQRGEEWRKANPRKTVEIHIQSRQKGVSPTDWIFCIDVKGSLISQH